MAVPMGILSYVVPHRDAKEYRRISNRLRRRIKGLGVPLSGSLLLIPWTHADLAREIIQEAGGGIKLEHHILQLAFDEKVLEHTCTDAFQRALRRAKDVLLKKMDQVDEKRDDPKQWSQDNLTTIEQAQTKLANLREMAKTFSMSNHLEYAFDTFEEYLEAKKLRVETLMERDEELQKLADTA